MRKVSLYTVLVVVATAALLTSCGTSVDDEGQSGGSATSPLPPPAIDDNDYAAIPDASKVGVLVADGNTENTYKLINKQGYNYEVPDVSRSHAAKSFQHIQQQYDSELKRNAFAFHIHALIDDDRGLPDITDRQRNEIKTDNKSPKQLVAQEGETLRMTWKMKLPAGFQTTKNFTHLHQLKGIDNAQGTADVSTPLVTLTACTVQGEQKMQLRYDLRDKSGKGNNKTTKLITAPLKDFLGQWVSIQEEVTFGENGGITLSVYRLSDGKLLMRQAEYKADMWRTGTAGMRPKWGVYRYLGDNRSMENELRDEVVLFNDFAITKK